MPFFFSFRDYTRHACRAANANQNTSGLRLGERRRLRISFRMNVLSARATKTSPLTTNAGQQQLLWKRRFIMDWWWNAEERVCLYNGVHLCKNGMKTLSRGILLTIASLFLWWASQSVWSLWSLETRACSYTNAHLKKAGVLAWVHN